MSTTEPFHWEGTMTEFDAEVRRRWIESSERLGLDHGMPNAAAALAAEQRAAAPETTAPDELAMLRADLADAEALIAKWPRCPAGCACRIGIEDDPDRNECGCDGPCNGGTARAALHDALRTAAGRIKRCTSAKPVCTFCEADLAAVMEAADAYAASAPELAAAMREARLYREAITALADWLKTSAAATHPSKKSAIEFELIRKLQKILEGK